MRKEKGEWKGVGEERGNGRKQKGQMEGEKRRQNRQTQNSTAEH